MLLAPTSLRRERLAISHEFHCECGRCRAAFDDALVFPCASQSCPGSHQLSDRSDLADAISASACVACGCVPGSKDVAAMLQIDSDVEAALHDAEAVALDGGDTEDTY